MAFSDGQVLTASDLNDSLTKHEEELTAGENLSSGDVCYLKNDGKMWKADADSASTASTLIGIATENISADATGTFLLRGKLTTSGLTAGSTYYLSTTAGGLTTTPPSGSGDVIRIIGYALSSTVLYVSPDETYLTM